MSSSCKGCGKPIVWGMTSDGRKIPLDPQPPVYSLSGFPAEQDKNFREVGRADREQYMVSHFATCPKASDFSGSKRR